MLSGELPFKGTTPLAVIRQQIEERPRRLRDLRSDVPRALERVVERSMEKDPRKRFQSASEMARALRATGLARAQRGRQVRGKAPVPVPAIAVEPAPARGRKPSGLKARAKGRMSGLRGFIYGFTFFGIVVAAALVAAVAIFGDGSGEIEIKELPGLGSTARALGDGTGEIYETVAAALNGSVPPAGSEPAGPYNSENGMGEAEAGEPTGSLAHLPWPPIGEGEVVVFEEDFNDWVTGWDPDLGAEVEEEDGNRVLHIPKQPDGWSTGHILEDGRMSFNFRSLGMNEDSDELLIVATHYTHEDEMHYRVVIWPDRITLAKVADGDAVPLATHDLDIARDAWHMLTLTVLGPQLIVDLDGETVLANFYEGMVPGSIRLQQVDRSYHIDDVQIVLLSQDPPEPIVPIFDGKLPEPALVVYRDEDYPASWDSQLDYITEGLASRGYEVVGADQLSDYMMSNDVNTCVVFAQDVVPATVVDDPFAPSSDSLFSDYMRRGGRVVWIKDVPLFYVGLPDRESIDLGDESHAKVLGMPVEWVGYDNDEDIVITEFGAQWGLIQTWISMRPTAGAAVTLAVASESRNSSAYYLNMGGPPLSGFVRIWDTDDDFVTPEHLDDLDRVCRFRGSPSVETGPLFPANGHYYGVVRVEGGLTWPEAKEAAESMLFKGVRGHLATITSHEENRWIVDNTDLGSDQLWMGGIQKRPNDGPDSDWRWVTGEPWSFTNWNDGEPNDAGGDGEFYLTIWDPSGTWNDENPIGTQSGYVVEFPLPFVADPRPIPAEKLFRRAMKTMNNLKSFRMKGQFVQKSPRGAFEMALEGERSGRRARVTEISRDRDRESRNERILVPPYVYYSDDPEGGRWHREPMDRTEAFGDSMLDAGEFMFPHPDTPLRFYKLMPLGVEHIGDVDASHIRVKADWRGIGQWLESQARQGERSARASGYSPEEFLEAFSKEQPGRLDVWIDEDGFLRKMTIEFSQGPGVGYGEFQYFDFNEHIDIQPPDRFQEIPAEKPAPVLAPAPTPTLAPRARPKQPFGPLIKIRYNNSLHLCGCDRDRGFEDQWEPGRWLYESQWEYHTDYPVALSATLDRPLNPHDDYRRTFIGEDDGAYTYSWEPDRGMHLNLEPRPVADSGLLLTRSVTPAVLQPGITKVLMRATVKLVRAPSIHDLPVQPVGINMGIDVNSDQRYDGMEDIRVVSVSDKDTWRDFGPFFDKKREYVIEFEAVLENPNSFPVSYLPAVSASLEIEPESAQTSLEVSLPKGFETAADEVSFEAVGLGGEWVRFTFTNPSDEVNSWIFEGELRGISHWWQSAIQPAR